MHSGEAGGMCVRSYMPAMYFKAPCTIQQPLRCIQHCSAQQLQVNVHWIRCLQTVLPAYTEIKQDAHV
jgi:hypothetical protein